MVETQPSHCCAGLVDTGQEDRDETVLLLALSRHPAWGPSTTFPACTCLYVA